MSSRSDTGVSKTAATQFALELISARWKLAVLLALRDRPLSFNELLRILDTLSRRSLVRAVRGLQRDGLIERRVRTHGPVRVRYSITALGESLCDALAPLGDWSRAYREPVRHSRERYDFDASEDGW